MQLAGEVFYGRNDSRCGPVDGVADDGKTAIADCVETAPSGAFGQDVEIILSGFGVRTGENEEVRLEANDFFKIHLRPILRRVHDGGRAGALEGIGDKRILADGDQWIGPDDEENAPRGKTAETLLEIGEMALEIGG